MNQKITRAIFFIAFTLASFSSYAQEPFIGEVKMFAGNFAPRNWALCEGQLLPISSYSALFSILGTTYGGDGRTTFALPDLRGRVAVGAGNGPGLSSRRDGQKFGNEITFITVSNLPAHNHSVMANNEPGTSSSPSGHVLANTNTFDNEYTSAAPNVSMSSSMIGNTGSGTSVSIEQPSLVINYIICLVGVYPSRS